MKFRRIVAATLGCVALTVAAPSTATAFPLVDLLPKGIADLVPSGSFNPFAPPPAPPAPPAPPSPPAPQTGPAPQVAPAPPAPRPAPSAPSGGFKNCTEAWNAGAAPVHRNDPGYAPRLDRDNDGIGCERDPR
ncbi:excalibur calcium-binding domain-containing protein [Rhodococcus pyridinivorans]|uniref:excalibur calcium-binding domain-containing protein n=1 Tax=Rhodococcus TaxID=1827 RepID=UPI0002DE8789|nr:MULTISPECIES: excalibur calcium-binding domain-containing protein [Rhodococcus]APE08362.1 calcium-binding protein [Rhodococcus sp. 2G]AWZ24396.1 calcium-binding protein [Rhodococcus pyridinivorans]MCD5418897.1 excalibur calcium-binding domain-containing protein [Rhodococcus pyridinivorans]MCW3468335.1 excalibur calcium-binding domain-containing protein [Rhodococcus pyridinivorans]QQM54389.1 excalibur calcium-binding domain-containing protein [Rhodococcus pyridinivorans]